MAQYIDKAVVDAEIDRVLNSYDKNEITSGRYALADLRDFINTLESKELYLDDTAKETPSNKTLFNKTDSTLEDAWNKLYVALHKVQELEKQGEHKDDIDAKPKFNVDDCVVGKYQPDDGIIKHKCAIYAVDKLYKQNPAWSEEDSSKVQRICKYLEEAKKYYADSIEARECVDWLKSLEERVIPKQKQE